MVRACAAYKAGVVLSDPFEREGRRTILNLGHTFAHALETGSGYTVSHGEAVALGLLAALRLSGLGTEVVEELLRPEPVAADPDAAWAALKRDKKGEGVFVLLEAPGQAGRDDPSGRRRAAGARVADPEVDSAGAGRRPERGEPERACRAGSRALRRDGVLRSSRLGSTSGRSELGCSVRCFQTNHEGEFIDTCHEARRWADGVDRQPGRVDALQLRDAGCARALHGSRSSRYTFRTSRRAGGMAPRLRDRRRRRPPCDRQGPRRVSGSPRVSHAQGKRARREQPGRAPARRDGAARRSHRSSSPTR